MDRHEHKDSTLFRKPSKLTRGQTERDFAITEEEVELALRRLQARVEGEAPAAFWQPNVAPERPEGEGQTPAHLVPPMTHGEVVSTGAPQRDLQQPENAGLSVLGASPKGTSLLSDTLGVSRKAKGHQKAGLPRRAWRRIAWGTAAAAVLIGVVATPLGGKAMAAAMQTFYFHNLVGVSVSDLNQIQQALVTSGVQKIDLKQYGSVQVMGSNNKGFQQNLSVQQASKLVGYPIKTLPGFDAKRDLLSYQSGNQVIFHLNVNAINSLVARLGGKAMFPTSVNEQPIAVQVPPQVVENVVVRGTEVSLTMRKLPVVQVPDNVDMNQVRQALIGLPFLPQDIRQSLTTSSNWQDTLYLPVGGKAINMTLNGNPAVLQVLPGGQQRQIMWLEHGVLYQLSGSTEAFPTNASIIAQAKGLSA